MNEEVDVKELIENVTASSGYRYQAKDDRGNSLDTLKIIEDPHGAYLGVYHSQVNDTFIVKLAISSDLLSWHWVTDLDTEASQPTIQLLSDNGYLVIYEKSGPGNTWLRFRYYADRSDLSQATYQNEFDAPRTLAPTAEGTPNIYSAVLNPDALHSRIEVGFHYYRDQDVDRQARGTLTNFSSWTTQVETSLNTQLEAQNIAGNIGDRDFFQYHKRLYNLHEAQLTKNNASTWWIYLYDYSADMIIPLSIKTHKGSHSFANPTFTAITTPSGRPGFVATMFLFASGAAAGEAGSLIYFKEYSPLHQIFLPMASAILSATDPNPGRSRISLDATAQAMRRRQTAR